MKLRRDPLAVKQTEVLKLIEHLEKAVAGLQDVDAGVLRTLSEGLRQLREYAASEESPQKWRYLQTLASERLTKLAVKLMIRLSK